MSVSKIGAGGPSIASTNLPGEEASSVSKLNQSAQQPAGTAVSDSPQVSAGAQALIDGAWRSKSVTASTQTAGDSPSVSARAQALFSAAHESNHTSAGVSSLVTHAAEVARAAVAKEPIADAQPGVELPKATDLDAQALQDFFERAQLQKAPGENSTLTNIKPQYPEWDSRSQQHADPPEHSIHLTPHQFTPDADSVDGPPLTPFGIRDLDKPPTAPNLYPDEGINRPPRALEPGPGIAGAVGPQFPESAPRSTAMQPGAKSSETTESQDRSGVADFAGERANFAKLISDAISSANEAAASPKPADGYTEVASNPSQVRGSERKE